MLANNIKVMQSMSNYFYPAFDDDKTRLLKACEKCIFGIPPVRTNKGERVLHFREGVVIAGSQFVFWITLLAENKKSSI